MKAVLVICALLVIHTIATEINPSKQSSGEILTEVIPLLTTKYTYFFSLALGN